MNFVGRGGHESADFVGGAQFSAPGEISSGLRFDEKEELSTREIAHSERRLGQDLNEVRLEVG